MRIEICAFGAEHDKVNWGKMGHCPILPHLMPPRSSLDLTLIIICVDELSLKLINLVKAIILFYTSIGSLALDDI